MPNIYDFRSGRSLKNIDAQTIGVELERIRQEKGVLVASDVLEAAESPDSPLHAAFDWNEEASVRRDRLNQARRLITSIRVLNSPTAKPTVAFVSVRTPEHGRNYMPTTEALSDEVLKARVLQEVRVFIEGLQRRYAHFEEVASVLEGLKKRVG